MEEGKRKVPEFLYKDRLRKLEAGCKKLYSAGIETTKELEVLLSDSLKMNEDFSKEVQQQKETEIQEF